VKRRVIDGKLLFPQAMSLWLLGPAARLGADTEEPQLALHGSEPRAPGVLQHEAVFAAKPVRPGIGHAIHNIHAADDTADFEIFALWEPFDASLATDCQKVLILGPWSPGLNWRESRRDHAGACATTGSRCP